MRIIGFTGTRHGTTKAQLECLSERLANESCCGDDIELRHGCCIGADEELSEIAAESFPWMAQVGYPSNLDGFNSVKAIQRCKRTFPAKPPLDRNHDVVDGAAILYACPQGMSEERRSGTWATVRYARKKGIEVCIIWPDGRFE